VADRLGVSVHAADRLLEQLVRQGLLISCAGEAAGEVKYRLPQVLYAYANELAAEFIGPAGLDARTVYPSQPPGTPLVVDGTVHGNGFVNTGMIDADKSTPLPQSSTVTFSKPGTYQYYCIVHGAQMKGQITVTN
jgi:hypothetical protein